MTSDSNRNDSWEIKIFLWAIIRPKMWHGLGHPSIDYGPVLLWAPRQCPISNSLRIQDPWHWAWKPWSIIIPFYFFLPRKLFVCAVALTFKINYINIMFGNIKKQFTVYVGLINFMFKSPFRTKQLRARVYVRRINSF